eukprot:scaffold7985_cov108-Skeletonema_dohrnii-CCMP3373.AAC.4
MDHQQEEAEDQQLCDDGSILISACQSAVTHFFGRDVPEQPPQFDNDNGGGEDMGSLSEDDRSSPSKQQQQLSPAATSITLPSSSSNNSLCNNSNLLLYSRARSMSPSLGTDTTPLLFTCDPTILPNSNYYYESYISGGGSEESDYWTTSGYFETSDFTAQTWLNVLQETETIRYCGAGCVRQHVGCNEYHFCTTLTLLTSHVHFFKHQNQSHVQHSGAAILTAVIIIHPLALIGAAATAAVGASAAWAVGLFHDLDTGYQIWNHEDFGMLFWEEQSVAVIDDSDGVDTMNTITNSNTVAAGTATTAAIATLGSQQIIQQNEEGLRRAFLLEQEKMMQRNNALFKEEEESENDVQQDDDRDVMTMPQHHQRQQRQQQQQQTNVEKKLQSISLDETNRLIRVNSAPVKETSLSSQPRIKPSPGRSSKQQPHLLPPRQQNRATQHPTTLPPSILSTQQSLDRHYPPLEIRVVNQVEFHGLNT